VKLLVLSVVAVLTVGCGSSASDSPRSVGSAGDSSVEPIDGASESLVAAEASTCEGFEPQYIGSGLTVSLPRSATPTTFAGTADSGPIHASAAVEFDVGGELVTIGRHIGNVDAPEPGFDSVAVGGVSIFVKASDVDLRACLLASARYDAERDGDVSLDGVAGPETVPSPGIPSPDLGVVTDAASLVAALTASGALDNETAKASTATMTPSGAT
jgi:hypothetical protein